jgi:hypothetical protein
VAASTESVKSLSARRELAPARAAPAGFGSVDVSAPSVADRSARHRATVAGSSGARSKSPGTETDRQPDAEFTVVGPNESIEDVAVRVYGRTERSDALWRANRDSLPRRDTPLAAGVVLRTPSLR